MTKEEKIQEVYGNYWDELKPYVNLKNGIADIPSSLNRSIYIKTFRLIGTFPSKDGFSQMFIPREIQGIENNNGWVKIESISDLPTLGYYEVIRRDTEKPERSTLDNDFGAKISIKIYSHWKPILEIELPIF